MQYFRALNSHSYIDKYSMKEINDCIGDIGRVGSILFKTLDLTSGFWQMPIPATNTSRLSPFLEWDNSNGLHRRWVC